MEEVKEVSQFQPCSGIGKQHVYFALTKLDNDRDINIFLANRLHWCILFGYQIQQSKAHCKNVFYYKNSLKLILQQVAQIDYGKSNEVTTEKVSFVSIET